MDLFRAIFADSDESGSSSSDENNDDSDQEAVDPKVAETGAHQVSTKAWIPCAKSSAWQCRVLL